MTTEKSTKRKRVLPSPKQTNIFESISRIESKDVLAAKKRRTHTQKSISRGKAARSQTDLYCDLMECRILFQKALSLPKTSTDCETDNSLQTIRSETNDLLCELLECRRLLSRGKRKENESGSDTDDDNSAMDENYYYSLIRDNESISVDDDGSDKLDNLIQKEYEESRMKWKAVLDRQHSALRLHSGLGSKSGAKFNVVDQNFWDQIQSTITHDRLVKGLSSAKDKGIDFETNEDINLRNEIALSQPENELVFDDSKIYQHLLQEFIRMSASKQQGSSGAAEEAAQRLKRAMQKKFAKDGKDVDEKLAKDEKSVTL
eukprot:CAMPEP_0184859914 /NCGR_PEP_ID=MMETSP0580-20130426/4877_1 /TAXON_ID=1118495 /ORGANISM="Dactyliosolen fragilissimus" /LENGTH=316 /DNA_ID=CAMNT_0027356795 /DNA_START=41 /DNA_END=992 /DNA_ORIENTATION=+